VTRSHVTVSGTGPAIVLVHGVGLDHHMWDWVTPSLETAYTVVRYDLLGHGKTPDPGRIELDDLVDQLRDVIAQRCPTNLHAVMGLSIGGMIVQRFGIRYPGSAPNLIIANAVHDPVEGHEASYASRLRSVEENGIDAMIGPALDRWFTDVWKATHPGRVDWLRATLERNDLEAYLKVYRTFIGSHRLVTGLLGTIDARTLVMTGELDVGSTPAMTEAIAQNIGNASAVVLPGLHHVPPIEDPEAFLTPVRSFLEEAA
jgi:pimeloyl-ACP methyl ester carboxylesterase